MRNASAFFSASRSGNEILTKISLLTLFILLRAIDKCQIEFVPSFLTSQQSAEKYVSRPARHGKAHRSGNRPLGLRSAQVSASRHATRLEADAIRLALRSRRGQQRQQHLSLPMLSSATHQAWQIHHVTAMRAPRGARTFSSRWTKHCVAAVQRPASRSDRAHRTPAHMQPRRDLPLRQPAFAQQSIDLQNQRRSKHGIQGCEIKDSRKRQSDARCLIPNA